MIDANIACQLAIISPPIITSPIFYPIYSSPMLIDFTATSSESTMTCGALVYTLVDTLTGLAPDATVFTVLMTSFLQIYTVDNTKNGMSYSI